MSLQEDLDGYVAVALKFSVEHNLNNSQTSLVTRQEYSADLVLYFSKSRLFYLRVTGFMFVFSNCSSGIRVMK